MAPSRFGMLAVVALCTLCSEVKSQVFSNPITGTDPNLSNPYTTNQTVDPHVLVTGIGRGTGITGNSATNRYDATGWNASSLGTAISGNRYFTWTISPDANYTIDFGDIAIATQASASGPGTWNFQSSVAGFGTGKTIATGGSGVAGGAGNVGTISNAALGSSFDSISNSTEFRLYAFGTTIASGAFSVNSFTFDGTVALRSAGSLIWDGGGTSDQWGVYDRTAANQSNWNLNNIPTSLLVDSLQFAGSTRTTNTNDRSGLTVGVLSFDATAASFTLNGNSITLNSGIVNSSVSSHTINLPIVLGADQTWDTGSGNVSATGAMSGTASLTKAGTGTLTLAGTNTYSGTTTINSGTLQFAKKVSLYNNTPANWTATNIIVNSGGTLAFNVGGAGEFSSDELNALKAIGSESGGFKNGAILGIDTTNAGGNFTYNSVIANPNGGANSLGLTKLGSGTLTLGVANTYTGPTSIQAGTLTLTSSGAINHSSAITVASGATFDVSAVSGGFKLGSATPQTLSGTGTVVGLVTVASNGTIRGGDSSSPVGMLTLSNGLAIDSGGTIGVRIDATAANSSLLHITGGTTSNLAGAKIAIDGTGSAFTLNQQFPTVDISLKM